VEKPWLAEHPVSLEIAQRLIHTQIPEVKIHHIRRLGEGFDNTVIQINEDYVFRFPRRDLAMKLMEGENQILPEIVGRLPLLIPEPIFFGKPSKDFPYSFTGYKMVHGKTPYREPLEKKLISARRFAHFLKKLHQVPVAKAIKHGVTIDQMKRLDISFRKANIIKNVKLIKDLGYQKQADVVLAYTDAVQPFEPMGEISLVHGDIHIRNVLLDEEALLSGIIDWGDVHLGHRAIDVSFIYSYFPKQARQAFFEIYGAIDYKTEQLARFRAVFMLVRLFVYGIDLRDEQLIELVTEGLKLAIED
jgi:aminoglycoside phosphotransferase (APT) family kinase protein